MKVDYTLSKIFLIFLLLSCTLATEDENKALKNKVGENRDDDSLQDDNLPSTESTDTRKSRQNGIFLQSTVDNKEYLIFRPQSIVPILKVTGQYGAMNDEDNSQDSQSPSEIEKVGGNGDGIEVPLIPEDYATPETGPSDNVPDNDGEEEEEEEEVEEEQPDYTVLNMMKELERLEHQWRLRHQRLRREELALQRQQLDIMRRESILARREEMRRKAEYEADRLLAYRRTRRKQNLDNAKIFRLTANGFGY